MAGSVLPQAPKRDTEMQALRMLVHFSLPCSPGHVEMRRIPSSMGQTLAECPPGASTVLVLGLGRDARGHDPALCREVSRGEGLL